MKGFVQWTQNLGRDRAQQTMDQVRMAIKAQYAAGKIGLQEAQRLTELATGNANVEQSRFLQSRTRGQDITNFYMPYQEQADLRVKGTAATANLAQAGASNANARNADARTKTEEEMRGPNVDRANALAKGAWVDVWNSGEKGNRENEKAYQEIQQKNEMFPFEKAKIISGLNKDTVAMDKDRGVFGNTGGVASGTQGANGKSLEAAKQEFEARNTVSEALQGKNGTPAISPKEASERYGIPLNDGWFGDSLDWGRYDPTNTRGFSGIDAGASSTAPPSGRTALGQPTPLLPLPPLDSGVSNPIQKPAGQDVYRIHAMLRNAMQGGNEGETLQYAEQLARLLPSLDMSSLEGFARTAVKSPSNPNGVPKEIARAYWNATQNASR